MSKLAVNGTDLYYEDSGEGRPLLFVHGMCGDARTWRDQVARLSGSFRCVAYDRRGHTRSPLGEVSQRTVELHADDAAALIQSLDLAPCVLVGSSGGARIALDVVRRYPELLAGAVLSEPPAFSLDPEGGRQFVAALRPKIEQAVSAGGPRAGVDAFFDYVCPGLWRDLDEARKDDFRDNQVELFGDLQMPIYQVTQGDLAAIKLPCLIVSGSESLPVFRSVARTLAESIPDARFVELSGSGHVTYYERPAEFAASIRDFAAAL